VAVIRVLEARGLSRAELQFVAGLSLGEYTALWCAQSLDFVDGLRRATCAAGDAGRERDAELDGLADGRHRGAGARARRARRERRHLPGGEPERPGPGDPLRALSALDLAGARRRSSASVARGAYGRRRLPSECMRPAAERCARVAGRIRPPAVPFASNVTGELSSDPEAIRRQLADQVCARRAVGEEHAPRPRARRHELPGTRAGRRQPGSCARSTSTPAVTSVARAQAGSRLNTACARR
jgi:[acyl-carrier-protein] S-malonyltransferase